MRRRGELGLEGSAVPLFLAVAAACLVTGASAVDVRRRFCPERLVRGDTNVRVLQPIDTAAWIWDASDPCWAHDAGDAWSERAAADKGVFRRFRCEFVSDGTPLVVNVSADEQYVLLLDGRVVSRGPHRGSVDRWYYATYDVTGLAAGPHRMEAVVWRLGDHAPLAQLSWRGGFVLKAEGSYDASLTTGKGPWQTVRLTCTEMTDAGSSGTFGIGSQCVVTGESFLTESPADGWKKAEVVRPPVAANPYGGRTKGWMLFPSVCPDQISSKVSPGRIVNAAFDLTKRQTVGPHETRELWWDLGDYHCAYPELRVSGGKGATVTWGWTEALVDDKGRKTDRSAWRGMKFGPVLTDTFRCDGRTNALFTTPWWRCGRWCRLTVETADESLSIDGITLEETHYPLDFVATFDADDPSLVRIGSICRRTLEMCAHDLTMDCPYYEQQMYPGDSRIQLEILNVLTGDGRLARSVMTTFDVDRRSDGLVAMNFPTRGTQESATYTMCWILMFGDYLRWHDDAAFLRARMPGVRNALMNLALYENEEGLVDGLPGWCFVDWVEDWQLPGATCGVPPGGGPRPGVSAIENLFYALALRTAAAVDAALGEPLLAAHWRAKAERTGTAVVRRCWDATRGALADSDAKSSFSEHAQALALLADVLSAEQEKSVLAALETATDLSRASTYFSHYLFEAFARKGRADLILKRMDGWRAFLDCGARTTFEMQKPYTRSDCHAWSACPVYFFNTVFAGVKPSAPFFSKVRVAPQPAGLRRIEARTPSPKGIVETTFAFNGNRVSGTVVLPEGLNGEFFWKGRTQPLMAGRNVLDESGKDVSHE